jgi:hypothetical protein
MGLDQLTATASFDDVAAAIIGECQRRGYTRAETIACLSTGIQESGLRMVRHATADWVGYYQQDGSYPNRWSPAGNIRGFLDRLDVKRRSDTASPDPFKNIFWLQQRPSDPGAETAYARGRQAYLEEIRRHIGRAEELYNRQEGQEGQVTWTGDPVWLEEVLRPALGNRLKTLDGWQQRGHGDFKDIRGVMVHHTGNSRESAQSIANGRPDLPGPLSQLHIAPNGDVTIVAVGVAWHAGRGSYPWLPTDNANWHMIGIECAWPDIAANGSYNANQRWPDVQIISMRDTCAALIKKLGFEANRVIGHKEWAGAAQGKWDPGNLDMPWFRAEVAKDLRGEFDGPNPPPPVQPGPVLPPNYEKETWDQLRHRWPMLGGHTLFEAVAEIRDKVLGTEDKDKR